jgi:hypothetical protein
MLVDKFVTQKWQICYSPLLFNFALEYAIRRVWANQKGLKVNDTHQLIVYIDDFYTVFTVHFYIVKLR